MLRNSEAPEETNRDQEVGIVVLVIVSMVSPCREHVIPATVLTIMECMLVT